MLYNSMTGFTNDTTFARGGVLGHANMSEGKETLITLARPFLFHTVINVQTLHSSVLVLNLLAAVCESYYAGSQATLTRLGPCQECWQHRISSLCRLLDQIHVYVRDSRLTS